MFLSSGLGFRSRKTGAQKEAPTVGSFFLSTRFPSAGFELLGIRAKQDHQHSGNKKTHPTLRVHVVELPVDAQTVNRPGPLKELIGLGNGPFV